MATLGGAAANVRSQTAANDATRAGEANIEGRLACPDCLAVGLTAASCGRKLSCANCKREFPAFPGGTGPIPWLFADPTTTRLEWKARFHGFLHRNSQELERLRKARNAPQASTAGRRRIERLLRAREQHRSQVEALLVPLELDTISWPADAASLLHAKLPGAQGMLSYTSNVFRDWAWENGESEANLAVVDEALGGGSRLAGKRVLTLGGGAARLPYDLHRHFSPARSTIVDINPLLLQIASRVIAGETPELFEFPAAPLDAASQSVLHTLRAPEAVPADTINFVLADATNPPFAPGSFDTILTPWLIDILPQNLSEFVPQINKCLELGGLWINTGSLAFFHHDETWCYSEEEVLAIVAANGFEVERFTRRNVPYLQSPHSGYGRVENVFTFVARKVTEKRVTPRQSYLPPWILDTTEIVPSLPDTAMHSTHHLLKAQVLASIDGKHTIRQISRALARQYGLGRGETTYAVQRILIDAWEQANGAPSSDDL